MTRDNAARLAASRMFLHADDVALIQQIVRDLRLGLPSAHRLTVVDLGAGSGTTALSVLDEDESAEIITVDIDPEAVEWARKAVRNCYPEAQWSGVTADAADAALLHATFFGTTIDLLLHDAGHGRDDVDRDLRAWLPIMEPGARLWVHDYGDPPAAWGQPSSPGVREAVDQLVAEGRIAEYATAGLGWYGARV